MTSSKIESFLSASLKVIAMTAAIVLGICTTGCLSPTQTTITEYDAAGKIVKETITSESVIKSVTDSTKDKSIIVWESGWLAYLSASTATTENPTPTVKMGAGKVDKGAITIHKEHKDIISVLPEVIKSTRQDLSVSATNGVSSK